MLPKRIVIGALHTCIEALDLLIQHARSHNKLVITATMEGFVAFHVAWAAGEAGLVLPRQPPRVEDLSDKTMKLTFKQSYGEILHAWN